MSRRMDPRARCSCTRTRSPRSTASRGGKHAHSSKTEIELFSGSRYKVAETAQAIGEVVNASRDVATPLAEAIANLTKHMVTLGTIIRNK